MVRRSYKVECRKTITPDQYKSISSYVAKQMLVIGGVDINKICVSLGYWMDSSYKDKPMTYKSQDGIWYFCFDYSETTNTFRKVLVVNETGFIVIKVAFKDTYLTFKNKESGGVVLKMYAMLPRRLDDVIKLNTKTLRIKY